MGATGQVKGKWSGKVINKPRLGLSTRPEWLSLGVETNWLSLGTGNDWLSLGTQTNWLSLGTGSDRLSLGTRIDWLGLGTGSDRLGLGKRTYRKVGLSQAGRSVEEVLSPGFLRSAEESPILNAPYTARLLR